MLVLIVNTSIYILKKVLAEREGFEPPDFSLNNYLKIICLQTAKDKKIYFVSEITSLLVNVMKLMILVSSYELKVLIPVILIKFIESVT